jgi:Na+/H+ antiporter NhaD/arsenite permease-like protein
MNEYGLTAENIRIFLAVIIFLITYGIIITDTIHRMVTAFAGAGLLLLFGILDQEKA